MSKNLKIIALILLFLSTSTHVFADRVGEGLFFGGLAGAAIGGAAGGGRGAGIGALVGAGTGAAIGAAAERNDYYDDYYYDDYDYPTQTVYYVQPTQKINRLIAQRKQTQKQLQTELAKDKPSQKKINKLNQNIQQVNAHISRLKNTRVRVVREY